MSSGAIPPAGTEGDHLSACTTITLSEGGGEIDETLQQHSVFEEAVADDAKFLVFAHHM